MRLYLGAYTPMSMIPSDSGGSAEPDRPDLCQVSYIKVWTDALSEFSRAARPRKTRRQIMFLAPPAARSSNTQSGSTLLLQHLRIDGQLSQALASGGENRVGYGRNDA